MQIHCCPSEVKRASWSGISNAFTLLELLVIAGTIVFVACLLPVSLARGRQRARTNACVDNLKHIGVAFRTWAIDQGDLPSTGVSVNHGGTLELANTGEAFVHFRAMSNELSIPKILVCPADPAKTAAANFNCGFDEANVSYFISPDARDVFPQMFYAGDRNLAVEGQSLGPGMFVWTSNNAALSWSKVIHKNCGNVGLADGSVHFLDSAKLALAAAGQSCDTNRLAIP